MSDTDERSCASRGSQAVAYAVIDNEGFQHSLWFLEKDATSEAALVGGTVVRLGVPTLTDAEREAIEWASTVEWGNNPHAATLRGLLERLGGGL